MPRGKTFLRGALNPFTGKKVHPVMLKSRATDLRLLDALVEAGKLRVVVDSRFPLEIVASPDRGYTSGMKRASRGLRWMLLPTLAALGCSRNQEPAPLPATAGVPLATSPAVTASAPVSSTLPSAAASAPVTPTAAAVAPGPAKYPLRWAARLKLEDIAAIAAAMTEKRKPNGEALTLTRGEGDAAQKVTVEDCTQYQKALEDGYDSQTTFDITQESFFKARCAPLRFLTEARPSAESWVKDLRLDKDPLAVLPASMNIENEGPSDDQKAAIDAGARLKVYSPTLVVKRKAADAVMFVDPESKIESTVDVVAFGDLDHDGIEDVLLFQTLHSLEGSLRSYHHVVATRKGPDKPLVVFRALDR